MARVLTAIVPGAALTLAATLALSAEPAQERRATPQFRAGITLVPVDVRVLGPHGQPVTDLARDDFEIFEDDVPQTIQEFLRTELEADPQSAMTPLAAGPMMATTATLTPQTRRVFLIVIGRGRQTGPVRIFDALASFVRERLLPQDQVAVIGYNRATDFTTDHLSVAELLERDRVGAYRDRGAHRAEPEPGDGRARARRHAGVHPEPD